MIPQTAITEWNEFVPWRDEVQVEQDLIICKSLVEIYKDDYLAKNLAFRGGTALHKLYLHPQPRYSEDINLLLVKRGIVKAEKKAEEVEHLPEIAFEDFEKLELRLGKVVDCKTHPKADRLLVSQVQIGEEVRQIVSGIRGTYEPEDMIGKQVAVLCNLKPIKLRGVESAGMLLVAEQSDGVMGLLSVEEEILSGARIR